MNAYEQGGLYVIVKSLVRILPQKENTNLSYYSFFLSFSLSSHISGYHTTMPTDALRDFHEISVETMKYGMPECKQGQQSLGDASRSLLESKGLTSVAAPGFEAPGKC